MPGIITSDVEVTHISKHGFWIMVENEELAVPFQDFPWFKGATIEQLLEIEHPTKDHLYWPLLDIDLSVVSIKTPEAFPLISQAPLKNQAEGAH